MKNKNYFKINLIYLIAIFSVAIIFTLGYAGVIRNEFLSSFLIQIVVMLAVPLLLYTLLVSKSIKKTLDDTGLKKINPKMIFISIGLGIVLYLLNTFVADIFHVIISLIGFESLKISTTSTIGYGTLLKEFALTAILPGICEEFLHRGIMLMTSKKYHNPRIALLISSILFGLMHMNISQFFYAAILGGLIGYVALVSDSIIPCMIIHFLNNFFSIYFQYGTELNFPLANFINVVSEVLMSNIFIYVTFTTIIVLLAILAYLYLTKQMTIERVKINVYNTLVSLQIENTPIELAQQKLNDMNYIISKSENAKSIIGADTKQKTSFIDKIPLIASIILGSMVTIFSFIWGII